MAARSPHSGDRKMRAMAMCPRLAGRWSLSGTAASVVVMAISSAKRPGSVDVARRARGSIGSSQPQQVRDDVALDIVGPGVDQAADAVAKLALEAGLLGVAGGAEDADGVEAVLVEALG